MNIQKKGKDFWGPPMWTMIHITSLTNPNQKFIKLLELYTKILPCDYCKKNLQKKLNNYDPEQYLGNSKKTFLYSYIIHDLANKHINRYGKQKRKKISPNFENCLKVYQKETPMIWGSIFWRVIHILSITIKNDRTKYKDFLKLLSNILPCNTAKKNMKTFLRINNIDKYLSNNNDMFFYSYMLHDYINKIANKKSPEFFQIKNFYYSSLGEKCDFCESK